MMFQMNLFCFVKTATLIDCQQRKKRARRLILDRHIHYLVHSSSSFIQFGYCLYIQLPTYLGICTYFYTLVVFSKQAMTWFIKGFLHHVRLPFETDVVLKPCHFLWHSTISDFNVVNRIYNYLVVQVHSKHRVLYYKVSHN